MTTAKERMRRLSVDYNIISNILTTTAGEVPKIYNIIEKGYVFINKKLKQETIKYPDESYIEISYTTSQLELTIIAYDK